MSYFVDYTALASLKSSLSVQANHWNASLKNLQTRVDCLSRSNKISGSGANNIKLYMESMYGTLIDLFAKLITLHVENFLIYQCDYHFKVDPQADTVIEETELAALKEEVESKKASIVDVDGAVKYALNNVRDIFSFSYSGDEFDEVKNAHTELTNAIIKIDNNIKQIEETHSSKSFVNSSQMVSVLKSFLSEASGQGRDFKQGFSPDKLNGLSTYSALLEAKLAVEKEIDEKEEEKKALDDNTLEEKDKSIKAYETKNPDIAKELDALLENVTEEHVREIKYYIYNVGEPYAAIYLNALGQYTFGYKTGMSTGYYSPSLNTINVDLLKEPENERGSYTTFFHESGHAIDRNFTRNGYYSETYRNKDGESLMDVIYEDVRNDLEIRLDESTFLSPESKKHVVDYIMGAKSIDEQTLTKEELNALEDMQREYSELLEGPQNEATSDIYGGVTNNIIVGDYGHWKEDYWYKDGKPTNAQCRELWAEYFSYCMTGNTEAMENLRRQFPQASAYLDEMAASMKSGG